MIVFFNKKDLFADKLKKKDIVDFFPDFKGPKDDYAAGADYFVNTFLSKNKGEGQVYHHLTCATDTANVKVVFNSCKDIILRNNLKSTGFME